MNLFILSLCVKTCARYMFDKHVSKIILEAVQMLSTAKQLVDSEETDHDINLYKISHKNHPVSIWVRSSLENYLWTIRLVEAMHDEWKYRYNHPVEKQHKSYIVAMYLKSHAPLADKFSQTGLTRFALAMPDKYKRDDPIESYRNYYQSEEKQKIASWKNREKPRWYKIQTKKINFVFDD